MIKNDAWIKAAASEGLIQPFEPALIRRAQILPSWPHEIPVISYGLSSYGYDIRLSPKESRIFRHIPRHPVHRPQTL